MDRKFYENFGALDKGVVFPTSNVDEELAQMTPEEARKAKRKWRKLKRRVMSTHFLRSKLVVRYFARRSLSDHGRDLFEEKK